MSTPLHTVTLMPLAERFQLDERATLLQALEAAGFDTPNSCRNGTCRTCICRVREGLAVHTIDWPGLSFDEKRDGYVLPCVAQARSDLVLEAPLARRLRAT